MHLSLLNRPGISIDLPRYTNLLRAFAKFPAVCSTPELCRFFLSKNYFYYYVSLYIFFFNIFSGKFWQTCLLTSSKRRQAWFTSGRSTSPTTALPGPTGIINIYQLLIFIILYILYL